MSNKNRNKSLGRGLSALLGEKGSATTEEKAKGSQTFIPIEHLHPGKYQPRDVMDNETIIELANSISEKGVLQPLLVRGHPDHGGEYEIVAGERRWRAAQKANLHEVPVIIRELSDVETLEIGLIENLQRKDLTSIEEAEGYQRLLDEFNHTQEKLANVVGKSRSHVTNTLRLLSLPESVRVMIGEGVISAGHARALIGRDNPFLLAKKIVEDGLSVRAVEEHVRKMKLQKSVRASNKTKDAETMALEKSLSEKLGLSVNINEKNGSGSLKIHYKTLDQLDDILRLLGRGDN